MGRQSARPGSNVVASRLLEVAGTILTQRAPYEERIRLLARELCAETGLASVPIDTYDPTQARPFVRIAHPELGDDVLAESLSTATPEQVEGFVASMLARREPLVLEQAALLTSSTPRMRQAFIDLGVRTLVAFPVIHQDEMIGTLWCSSREPAAAAKRSLAPIRRLLPHLATFIRAALNEANARSAHEKLAAAHQQLGESGAALRESEERFRALVQNSSDMITIVDARGIIRYASPAVERILGHRPEHWIGLNITSIIHPEDAAQAAASLSKVTGEGGVHRPLELRVRHRDGSWRVIETVATNLLDDPVVAGIVHNSRDVTQRREAERARRESEERFQRLAEHGPVGIYQMSPDRKDLYLNQAAMRIFEASNSAEVVQAGHERFFGVAALQSMEAEHRKRSAGIASNYEVELVGFRGTRRTVLISGAPLLDDSGELQSIIGTITDISERKRLEEALRHQAFHDPLTRLANRARFGDRLEHGLERAKRSRGAVAVLFLDLDDFKAINDRFGHSVGDLVLIEAARRIHQTLRPGDTAARFGGDEFAILLEDLAAPGDAKEISDRVLKVVSVPFVWEGNELPIRASIGIAVADGDYAGGAEEMLRSADVAMYAAKSRGKGRVEAYEAEMSDAMMDRFQLLADLERAVAREEFVVHYQPTVELASGRIIGVEALVRWNHPTRGLLPPTDFIPLAEQSGAIVPLGLWVLRAACTDVKRWQSLRTAQDALTMSVNISARQLQEPDFVNQVTATIAESGIAPDTLVLEVTESLMMHDVESTLAQLRALKALGIRLAIDDFGTGYSSLSYLSQFPFDILKMDKSFVDGAGASGGEKELMPAIIDLGKMLKMEIVAEGIERPEQLARLRALDCDLGQGFLFARPLTRAEIEALLSSGTERLEAA